MSDTHPSLPPIRIPKPPSAVSLSRKGTRPWRTRRLLTDPSLSVPLLKSDVDYRISTAVLNSAQPIDLRFKDVTGQDDPTSSTLSALTQRANNQVCKILQTLNSPRTFQGQSHTSRSHPEASDYKSKDPLRNFEKNFQEVQHLLDEIKKREATGKEDALDEAEERAERKEKQAERLRELRLEKAHYLTPTKAYTMNAVTKAPTREGDDVFTRIEKIKTDPQENAEFQKRVAGLLIQMKSKKTKIVIDGPTLSYRKKLDQIKEKRLNRMKERFMQEIRRKELEYEKHIFERNQQRWAWLVTLTSRFRFIKEMILRERTIRIYVAVQNRAAITIQRAWRRFRTFLILHRLRRSLFALRRITVRFLTRRRMQKKIHAANTIYQFLKDNEDLSALARAIRRFQFSVISVQRFWKRRLAVLEAQRELLALFFTKVESHYIKHFKSQARAKVSKEQGERTSKSRKKSTASGGNAAQLPSTPVKEIQAIPRTTKEMMASLVTENFNQRRKAHLEDMRGYFAKVEEYQNYLAQELSKKKLFGMMDPSDLHDPLVLARREDERASSGLAKPKMPRFRSIPTVQEMARLVERGLRDAFLQAQMSGSLHNFDEFTPPRLHDIFSHTGKGHHRSKHH